MARAVDPPGVIRLQAAQGSHGCGHGDAAGGAGASAGPPLVGAGTDYTKCFDLLPQGGSWACPAAPPPPPTAEQAMIALVQRQIASLEGVINSLRRELVASRGEVAPARSPATTGALAAMMTIATTTKTAAAAKKAAPTTRAAPGWQLAGGGGPSRRPRNAQAQQAAASPQRSPPPPSPVSMRVDGER